MFLPLAKIKHLVKVKNQLSRASAKTVAKGNNSSNLAFSGKSGGGSKLSGSSGAKLISRSDVNVKALSKAFEKEVNETGLTVAARALTKHATGQRPVAKGSRPAGTFPKLKGGIPQQNEIARKAGNEILNNSKSIFTKLKNGSLVVRKPNGQGLRFNRDGSFDTLGDRLLLDALARWIYQLAKLKEIIE